MNPIPKPRTKRDKAYLAWIRKQPCGYKGNFCQGEVEAHHVRRQRWGAGAGKKPHDYVAVPRCHYHHTPNHELDVELEIIDLLIKYFGKEK